MDILNTLLALHGSPFVYATIFLFAFFESLAMIGFAFPGTTMLVFVGYLCFRGGLNILPSIIMLSLGGASGDIISFYLGRAGKKHLNLSEKLIGKNRLLVAEKFFTKYGVLGVFTHRFIGPLRPVLPFAAGILKMPKKLFIPVDIFSNFISSLFYVAVGLMVGNRLRPFLKLLVQYEKILVLVLVLAIIGYVIYFRFKKNKTR